MRRIIGFFIFILLTPVCFSQNSDSNFATIQIFSFPDSKPTEIKIGKQPAFTIKGNQLVIFKLHSRTTAKIQYSSTGTFSDDKKVFKPVEKGQTYYYALKNYDGDVFWEVEGYNFKKTQPDSVFMEENTEVGLKPYTSGTGFLVSTQGYIITNYHVVEGSKRIYIRGINGFYEEKYRCKLIKFDKENDLALLRLDSTAILNTLPYSARWVGIETGENVSVLGYPLKKIMGEEIKLTTGIVSSKSGFEGSQVTYQISAPVQPGNSGSPMFDKYGNLIGIINAKLLYTEGVNYAIKIRYLNALLEDASIPNDLLIPNSTTEMQLVDLTKKYAEFVYIIETEK